jgi:hypothetical protein
MAEGTRLHLLVFEAALRPADETERLVGIQFASAEKFERSLMPDFERRQGHREEVCGSERMPTGRGAIDAAVALALAVRGATIERPASVYDTRGLISV